MTELQGSIAHPAWRKARPRGKRFADTSGTTGFSANLLKSL
jgi:hypothetical protein